jgi:hypothetical protein
MVTFTINIPPMLANEPYMDPMGMGNISENAAINDDTRRFRGKRP